MPDAFQAGAKERLVCGFVVPSCNHFCSPPEARRDGRQRFEKEKGGRGRRNRVTRSGGLGEQDVTEEKGLEKKRVIESEGSGLKEAGARRDGREGFGKEEGD